QEIFLLSARHFWVCTRGTTSALCYMPARGFGRHWDLHRPTWSTSTVHRLLLIITIQKTIHEWSMLILTRRATRPRRRWTKKLMH
ncbi:hypothetical protein LPJ58_005700, partial [Coemansia sp. RSA 1591]